MKIVLKSTVHKTLVKLKHSVLVTQSCPTLCNPPGSSVHGISQARILEIESESVSSSVRIGLFVTPWTVACQAPLSMGFSKQEYWSELPFPFPGDLPDPGIEPASPALQVDSLPSGPPGKPKPHSKKP